MAKCPYCDMEIEGNFGLHVARCPHEESNRLAIIDLLYYLSELGVMPSMRSYDRAAKNMQLAQSRMLRRIIGNWDRIAAWSGLIPRGLWDRVRTETARMVLCDLSAQMYDGKYGPTQSEYTWYAPDGVPNTERLRRMYGNWGAVLSWAGLESGPRRRRSKSSGEKEGSRRVACMRAEERLLCNEYNLIALRQEERCRKLKDGRIVTEIVTTLR